MDDSVHLRDFGWAGAISVLFSDPVLCAAGGAHFNIDNDRLQWAGIYACIFLVLAIPKLRKTAVIVYFSLYVPKNYQIVISVGSPY